jgi:imidazolonepropionase-like amidohydrolase
LLNGAKLLGWEGQIGALEPGYLADVVAVPGDPLQDISVLGNVVVRDEGRGGLQEVKIKFSAEGLLSTFHPR